ncbi:uncharacterized protein B0H18DRAFT_882857, partial [Fomitopsis serialis]|uniref:uncharacterized protein n=1 Tax=Fomitopsis serialis TaxID=139415 RepID=UPI002007C0F5
MNYPHLSHWPASYSNAYTVAQGSRGQLHFGTAEIPAHDIPTFYRRLRRYMNRIPQFQGAFFYHEVRGAKGGTHHDPEDNDDAEFALQDVFGHLDFDQITDDDLNHRWFVDVALEVRRPGHVVHWRRDNMERIIRHAVPHGSPLTISHLPRGKVLKIDHAVQLSDVAGFRVGTPSLGSIDRVRYINVYSTEKSAHYQLHNGHFDAALPLELLPGKIDKLLKRVNEWTKVFNDCKTTRKEGTGRYEIRVAACKAGSTLKDIPYDLLQDACLSWPAVTWWTFKWWRVFCCYTMIEHLKKSPNAIRARDESLQLGVVLTHMLNGCLYR